MSYDLNGAWSNKTGHNSPLYHRQDEDEEESRLNMVNHYNDVRMSTMASQITSLTIIYSPVYSGKNQRKHQSSVSLVLVRGIHRWSVNFPHKGSVTWKMFPFDDVIMKRQRHRQNQGQTSREIKQSNTHRDWLTETATMLHHLATAHVALVAIIWTTILMPYL